jgi:crossover junction endodeoxyribonuclease RuvC
MRVIGLDPGLRHTGWGVIERDGSRLRHLANGTIRANPALDLPERLTEIYRQLQEVIETQQPQEAAVEITLANRNPGTSLKLGMARGVVLLVPALLGLPVAEYLPLVIKKAVVGAGHADKRQVSTMVAYLLPDCRPDSDDAADALAVAICHAHSAGSKRAWAAGLLKASGAGR